MSIEAIQAEVARLLGGDDGHGIDHVLRVRDMAVRFAKEEDADAYVVELASLLHDVDDYKLFGEESAKNLSNAKAILAMFSISEAMQSQVLEIIRMMGYNKYLDGTRPDTLEGKVVSDADMCDAIGAEGILRTHAYALSKGNLFFDPELPPESAEASADEYRKSKKSHSVQHFFDKLLCIPSIMLTNAGKHEASKREKIMVDFLCELFREEGAEQWQELLDSRPC